MAASVRTSCTCDDWKTLGLGQSGWSAAEAVFALLTLGLSGIAVIAGLWSRRIDRL